MSDGLTVPFALAAGISGAIASSHLVVTAGIAELAAGGISMGLGGYLAARTDSEHYASERRREEREVAEVPNVERGEVVSILRDYGLDETEATRVGSAIAADRKRWVDFMMRFELGLEAPDRSRAPIGALTIGGAYVIGGIFAAVAVLLRAKLARRTLRLCDRHAHRTLYLRRRQGFSHGGVTTRERLANDAHRRHCRNRSVPRRTVSSGVKQKRTRRMAAGPSRFSAILRTAAA